MISKHILQFTAIALVCLLIVPQYVQARTTVEDSIVLDYPSQHEGEYDELVNVANESAARNPDTWDPTYQGVWVGGPTKESLFQFNDVVTDGSRLAIGWTCRFTSSQIMSGASEMVVRLPVAVDEAVSRISLRLFAVSSPDVKYNIAYDTPEMIIAEPVFENRSEAFDMLYLSNLVPDGLVLDGNDIYCTGDRAYVTVRAPIVPDQDYLIFLKVQYKEQSRFKMYLSPNDVCSDGAIGCQVARYVKVDMDRYTYEEISMEIDPGYSFDFRQGLGNGIASFDMWVDAQKVISLYSNVRLNGTSYHTLMIPFESESGSVTCSIKVYTLHPGDIRRVAWEAPSKTYYSGYIIASSPSKLAYAESNDYYVNIEITVESSQRLKFIMQDIPNVDDKFDPLFKPHAVISTAESNTAERTYIGEEAYGFHVFSAYQMTEQQAFAAPPANPVIETAENAFNRRLSIWDQVAIALIDLMPMSGVINIYVQGTTGKTIGEWAWRSINYLIENGDKVIPRLVQNAIDATKNAMEAVGKFLWSVGEFIFDVLNWVVDATVEYGSVLLGLLIIAVALALFFAPIYTQLKLWGIAWRMAEGDVQAAAAQAQDLASQASGVMSKFRRH